MKDKNIDTIKIFLHLHAILTSKRITIIGAYAEGARILKLPKHNAPAYHCHAEKNIMEHNIFCVKFKQSRLV